MFSQDEEIRKIVLTISLSTFLILVFAIIVIVAILKYRRKQREYADREKSIKTELIKAVLEAKEEVLEDIADQVHIDIQQTLSLAKLSLNQILYTSNAAIQQQFDPIKELVNKAITEVKTLSRSFDPKMITGHTLEDNIARQLDRLRKKSNIETAFNTSESEIQVSNEKQIFIYRIVQEAINNILAHAKATKITIGLENKPNHFVVRIKDNGIGFPSYVNLNGTSYKTMGIGLRSIQHRTELMNGKLEIKREDKHTLIILTIPYD